MRLIATALSAVLLLLLAVVPASAQEDTGPLRLEPCEKPGEKLEPGAPIDVTVDGPTVLDGEVLLTYVLDLSGQEVADDEDMATTARVDASMTWLVVANDYDLGLNGSATEGFQPIDPAEESISATKRAHCSTVTVSVINFTATGLDPVDLVISASA
jgi:hypothetical protein